MKDNPFDKEQTPSNAYAIYINPIEFAEYKVIKTFTNPKTEQHDSHWLIANEHMITEDVEIIKMKVSDVKNYSFLMKASPNWRKYYAN
tara:strand:+ start:361 stop:624 length:264 start_codon:yes stop_codon:yes gene_type:complete